jgi:hypothetical protein
LSEVGNVDHDAVRLTGRRGVTQADQNDQKGEHGGLHQPIDDGEFVAVPIRTAGDGGVQGPEPSSDVESSAARAAPASPGHVIN